VPDAIDTYAVKFDKRVPEGLSKLYQSERWQAGTSYTDARSEYLNTQVSLIALVQSAVIQMAPTYPGYPSFLIPDSTKTIRWIVDNEAFLTLESSETQNATVPMVSFEKIELDVENIITSVGEEPFENGIVTKFSESIQSIIIEHGDTAVRAISHYILDGTTNPEVAGEALRWVGELDDNATYHSRRNLLEKALVEGATPLVRDGANIGLAQMDDPRSIPYFKQAIKNEKSDLNRKLLIQTLEQLENTLKCHNS